jgi:hypothetical protein
MGMGAQLLDMVTHLQKLRADAAEARRVSERATEQNKRELFARLADHFSVLAIELERAIKDASTEP